MKIAFIGQKGIPAISGGVEKHVDDLSRQLVSLGHQVYVYARPNYTDKKIKEYNGVKIINLPSIPTKHLDAISHTFFACLDVIFRRKYDVVHFHSIGPSSLIWLIRIFKPKTPVVSTFHTQCYFHQKWGAFARFALKSGEKISCYLANKVITVSKTLQEYARKKYKINPVYIPNGVYRAKKAEPLLIKEKWGLEKDSYILLVSRLIRHKGIHYAIEAYKKLKTDKKLVIVGDGFFTDEYVSELEQMAEGNENIMFLGRQVNRTLKELFSNAYLFVQPSESEGLSIALLEALSYGLPALVSDIPENKEAIAGYGFTFENKNSKDLKDKLNYLLQNKDITKEVGEKARKRVDEKYNWKNIAEQVVGLYRSLLK